MARRRCKGRKQQDQPPIESVAQSEEGSPERFTYEFHGDFQDIGILLDVDDEGRLVVQEVNANGEAGKYPTLSQQDLHIVAVGIVGENKESAADELLRQLITLPRPVRVEFARTTSAPPSPPEAKVAASSLSLAAPLAPSLQISEASQRTEPMAVRPPPEGEAHSAEASKQREVLTREEEQETKEKGEHSTGRPSLSDAAAGECEGGAIAAGPLPSHADARDNGGGGGAEGEEAQEGENPNQHTTGGPRADSKGKHARASQRPQRHGTLPEGIDWEENLRSSRGGRFIPVSAVGAAIAVSPAIESCGSHAPREDKSGEAPESVAVEINIRSSSAHGSHGPMGSCHSQNAEGSRLALMSGGSESPTFGKALPDGIGSIHSWLQDDSDDSEQEQTTLPRHSWYTANLMRGGHAPDVSHSNSFTRAAALAKARAPERSSSVSEEAARMIGEGEEALQGKEPSAVGKKQAGAAQAAPATVSSGGRGGGRLSNAVSARQHRSPSWCREDENRVGGGRASGIPGGDSGHGNCRTHAEADNLGGASDKEAAATSTGSDATPNDLPPQTSAATRRRGETRDKRDGTSGVNRPASKPIPRTGGVSARLHHSPSRILRGGATLQDDRMPPEGAGVAGTATRQTKPAAADRSRVRNQSSIKATIGGKGAAGDESTSTAASEGNVRATPAASSGTKSSHTASSTTSKPKKANERALPAKSSSASGNRKPSRQQGARGNAPSGKNIGGQGAHAETVNSGQSRGTKSKPNVEHPATAGERVRGACATAVLHERDTVDESAEASPPVTIGKNRGGAREDSSNASADPQPKGAANPAGRATAMNIQRHRRAYTNPSIISAAGSRDKDDPKADLLDRPKPFADSGGNEREAPGSLQNYKPFSWQANTRRTVSEGVMVGGGRSTPLRPSFFISLPEEEDPPQPPPPPPSLSPPPPPSLSLGGRRPSVGPVNPRAMYGHMPPLPPDDKVELGITRRPSVVIVPPASPRDQIDTAGKTATAVPGAASQNATQKRSKAGLVASSDVAGGYDGDRVAALGSKSKGRRVPLDSAESGSGPSLRKSKSSSGDDMHKAKSGRGSRAPGTKIGAVSSPNVLSGSSQGMIKVEKVELGLNKAQTSADVGFTRHAPSESIRWQGGRGMGMAGAVAQPVEIWTSWRNTEARDTVTPIRFTEASVQELRKLAAERQDSPSSSEEDDGEEEGSAHTRNRPEVEGEESSKKTMSWEQQLRTMAGVDMSSAAFSTSRRRPSAAGKKRRSLSGVDVGAGGDKQAGGSADNPDEVPRGKKSEAVSALTNGAVRIASEPGAVASPAATPPPTSWNLRIDVGRTQTWNAKNSGEPPAAAVGRRKEGGGGGGGGGENEWAVIGGACGRGRTGRFRGPSSADLNGGSSGCRTRARSTSRAVSSSAAPKSAATAAAAAAARAAAAAVSQLRRRGKRTTPRCAAQSHAAEVAKTAATAAVAESDVMQGASGCDRGRSEQRGAQGPVIARVRVRVRSSIYLVVADVEKDGSVLLAQVMEAEAVRHGQKAATVTGLMNESTGDTVDMDVPAERSISSGDFLTALVVGQAARSARSASASPATRPNTTETSDRHHGTGEGVNNANDAPQRRGRAGQRRDHHQAYHHRQHNGSSSCERPRGSPLRLELDNNGHGYGDEGRGGDIDQLREDVARRLYKERLLAGGGAGAASPPTRPIGSAPITPVTGGGRGASPEHSRPTSPRSASPRGAAKGPGGSPRGDKGGEGQWGGGGSRPGSPTRSACSAASGYTHCSGFSVRSRGRGGGKGAVGNSDTAFLAQSTLTPEELDGILKEELLKSRKWSARNRSAQDRICRVWEERAGDYARLQREHEEAEAARKEKARRRREVEAAQAAARTRQRTARAELALQQARSSRGSRDSRARAAEAAHRRRMQQITERRDKEQREHAAKVQTMDRRREDVRDSFLDMVDAENETAIQALETPLETLNRALEEGDEVAEKKARRAMLRQAARERVHVREKAARVLADQRRLEQKNGASNRTRQRVESSMMPGPGQYNLRDFSEYGNGACSRPLV